MMPDKYSIWRKETTGSMTKRAALYDAKCPHYAMRSDAECILPVTYCTVPLPRKERGVIGKSYKSELLDLHCLFFLAIGFVKISCCIRSSSNTFGEKLHIFIFIFPPSNQNSRIEELLIHQEEKENHDDV